MRDCSLQNISAVWDECHSHLSPLVDHLAFTDAMVKSCPQCNGIRTFALTADVRMGESAWLESAQILYCPDCRAYHFDTESQPSFKEDRIDLPITAVNARLWSATPTFLNIEPTTRCNFRCWYCIGRSMQQSDMKIEDFAKIFEHFPEVKTIALVGEGEPLLHAGFFDMANMAKERGVRIMITSNGSQFTESVIRRLCESGVAYVSVSIDSIEPKTFADSRPPGNLEDVWRGVELLRRYRDQHGYQYPKIGLKGTLFPHTVDELPLIIAEAKKRGMEIFESFQTLNPMITYLPCYPEEATRYLHSVAPVAAKISAYSKAADGQLESVVDFCRREQIEFVKSCRQNNLRPGCDEQWIYALLSGDVTPCCQIKHPISPVWNLFRQSMDTILGDTTYENLRFNLWNGIFPAYCSGCHKTGTPIVY